MGYIIIIIIIISEDWFGDVDRKEVDDWVSACRNLEVAGSRGRGRPIKYDLDSAVG